MTKKKRFGPDGFRPSRHMARSAYWRMGVSIWDSEARERVFSVYRF